MATYDKIQTLFKRDQNNNNVIIPSEFTMLEFEYLKDNKWRCEEKIDGTNIRIEIYCTDYINKKVKVEYKGRTDRAIIPTHLDVKLHKLFDNIDWFKVFPDMCDNDHITIYGEGYGYKIQEGHNYIAHDVNFILFDVRFCNVWLTREACELVAKTLGIKIVPVIGYMTIPEAIEYVKNGFKSTIAENEDYNAEGLVLKTPTGILSRNGRRIVTKLKTSDFIKLYNKQNNG